MLSARLLPILSSEFTRELQSDDLMQTSRYFLESQEKKRTQMFSYGSAPRGLQTNPIVLLPTLSAKLEQKKASHFHHMEFLNTTPYHMW